MKEEETRADQSTSAPPATSVSHTHTSPSESHNVLVIPGLPPLPQLPSPPTYSTPTTHYPSSLGGSEGGLCSASCEQEPSKSASLSQPCEKPLGSQRTVKPPLSVVTTRREPKMDAVLFNPAGLSKSERMSKYLATADTKTASVIEGSAAPPGLVGGRAAHQCVTPHSQVTGPTPRTTLPVSTVTTILPRRTGSTSRTTVPVSTVASTLPRRTGSTSRTTGPVSTVITILPRHTGSTSRTGPISTVASTLRRQTGSTFRITGPISTVASTLPRQTGSTPRHTGPAVDSSLHRVTSNSNGSAEMAKTLHCSSKPLIAVVSDCLLVCVCVCTLGSPILHLTDREPLSGQINPVSSRPNDEGDANSPSCFPPPHNNYAIHWLLSRYGRRHPLL